MRWTGPVRFLMSVFHVEHVIGQLKKKYTALQSVIPITLLKNKASGICTLDCIITVVQHCVTCALQLYHLINSIQHILPSMHGTLQYACQLLELRPTLRAVPFSFWNCFNLQTCKMKPYDRARHIVTLDYIINILI